MSNITRTEALDLLDALQEWHDVVGPKELGVGDVGLDADRYAAITVKLRTIAGLPATP